MGARNELYLLVTGEPLLGICRDWQRRYVEARSAAWDYAKGKGAKGVFIGLNDDVEALVPIDPIPQGWIIQKQYRRSSPQRMVPAKGEKGDAARAELDALPKHPKQSEIREAIGHPCQIIWSEADGSHSSFSLMGRPFNAVQLFWPAPDGPFLILAPNANNEIAELRKQHPGCIIEEGEWSIPSGCVVISEARKDLLLAEAKVRAEESGEDVAS